MGGSSSKPNMTLDEELRECMKKCRDINLNKAEARQKQINKKAFTELTGYYLDYNSPVCKKLFKNWDNYGLDIQNQNAKFLFHLDQMNPLWIMD